MGLQFIIGTQLEIKVLDRTQNVAYYKYVKDKNAYVYQCTFVIPAGKKKVTPPKITNVYSSGSVYVGNTTKIYFSNVGDLSVIPADRSKVVVVGGGTGYTMIKGLKVGKTYVTLQSRLNGKTVSKKVNITIYNVPGSTSKKSSTQSNTKQKTTKKPTSGSGGSTNSNKKTTTSKNATKVTTTKPKTTSSGTTKKVTKPKDTTPPTCTITPNISKATTNSNSITYTIKFSEPVKGFTKGDVTLSGGGSIKSFSGKDGDSVYKVVVNSTAKKVYTQKLSVAAGKCTDSAGNKNKASNAVSKNIDTIKPVIKNVKVTKSSKSDKITKSDKVYVEFEAYDTKYSKSNFNKDAITLKVGGKEYKTATKAVEQLSKTSTGAKYKVTLSNIQGSGALDVVLKSGQFEDTAGNKNDSYTYSKAVSTANQITVDNNKPTISSLTLLNSSGNKYDKTMYVKNGSTIQLDMKFSKALTTAPTIKIGDKAVTATKTNDTTYVAKYKIPSDEKTLKEGTITFSVSGYKSDNGLTGDTISKTTDSSTIIYDRTAPTIENINYNEEAGVAKNTEWRKSQDVTIRGKDNITTDADLEFKYAWIKEGQTSTNNVVTGTNGKTITKSDGTGKYTIYGTFTDKAGNTKMVITNPFYLDNSVTHPGTISAHKKSEDGKEYKFTKKEANTYEGAYCSDNVYIHKVDGTDEESGHKSTSYCVYKIVNGEEIAVGLNSLEDTIIENSGEYKVVVKSTDNLGNTGTTTYLIHKGTGNITFTPNGNAKLEGTGHTTIKLTDTTGKYQNIYYAWAEEGKEPEKYTKTISASNALKGADIDYPQENGKWNLYIKTIDSDGNENIVKSNAFNLAAKITNPGKLLFKFNNENGEEYKPQISGTSEATYSKENIYVKIADQGKDELLGNLRTTYQITNGNSTIIGAKTTESTILKDEGTYHVLATSTSDLGATKTIDYIVRIDKTSPNVIFSGTENYQTTGKIGVQINDEGKCSSELKEDTMKYYWTRNVKQPVKSDFEGDETEYRGTIKNTSTNISIPKNVSGMWYLWIYAEDNAGNIAIKSNIKIDDSGNISYVDNEAPIAGTLDLKINDKDGEEYITTEQEENNTKIINGEFTKENIFIKLLKGYDADSGVKTNTYSIKRLNDNKSFGNNITDDNTLTEHGKYEIVVTTIDNKNNSSTRKYIINIDKNGPQVSFEPNGDKEYSKKHTTKVSITETEIESGVDDSKTQAIWLGYNPSKIQFESKEEVINKIKELQEIYTDKDKLISELERLGIYYIETNYDNEGIQTPEGKTGIFYLYIKAQDKLENTTIKISDGFYIDNTNPTKPEITATKRQIIGTKEKDIEYLGEKTNKEITIKAQNSYSLSGVDKYEYSYTTDGGNVWTEWEDATTKENTDGQEITKGKATFNSYGVTIVKFRAIAKLKDGTLTSEESEEFVVNTDNKGPEVTFSNYENGENGSKENIKSIKVRATITDESGISEDKIKYAWVKFENIQEFDEFKKQENTLETLQNKMGEDTKVFSNGEEIPSPEDLNGIYSLFIYAEDKLGNKSVNYSEYYSFALDNKEEENKSPYELKGEYITKVLPNTEVEKFVENIKNLLIGTNYIVYDKDGNELKDTDIVTTASTLKVDDDTYTIIVLGDLNGDGKLSGIDIVRMRFSRVGKYQLIGAYEKAADVNNDENVNGVDLVRMRLINSELANFDE